MYVYSYAHLANYIVFVATYVCIWRGDYPCIQVANICAWLQTVARTPDETLRILLRFVGQKRNGDYQFLRYCNSHESTVVIIVVFRTN